MTAETFFANFGHLADAPNGVRKLRELILQLAVQGKLVAQDTNDEPAGVLIEQIRREKAQLMKVGRIRRTEAFPPIGTHEEPFDLPQGWLWVRAQEIMLSITDGDHLPPPKSSIGVPFLVIGDVRSGKLDFTGTRYVTKEYFETIDESRKPREGDLLYTLVGSYGIPVVVASEVEFCVQRHIGILKPSKHLVTKYLFHLYRTSLVFDQATHFATGIAQKTVPLSGLRRFLLPLPPLEEQKRIVAKLDQLMALCDELEARQQKQQQGRARLNNAALDALLTAREPDEFADHWHRISTNFDLLYDHPETIAKLRAAILQLAVQGKLVPQDPNDEPASVLLERIVAEKERLVDEGKIKKPKKQPSIRADDMPFDLPTGWEWCRVWDVAELITSGSRDWAKYYSDSGAIFVTMGNLSRGHYKLRMNTIRYVNPQRTGEGSRTKLEENDLLISITGDVGNLGLIPKGFGEAYINQHTCLLRFMPECQSRYFPEVMRSPLARYQYDAPQRGIKNSFRLGDVGEMIIPVPSPEEQKRIVTKVDQLMSLCDELEAKLNQAQQCSEKLMDATVRQLLVA